VYFNKLIQPISGVKLLSSLICLGDIDFESALGAKFVKGTLRAVKKISVQDY
jgi:hypothetical protein